MTSAADSVLALSPIALTELAEAASLQTRTDRKYIVTPEVAADAIRSIDGLRALEIDGRRSFAYESVYFDTPDLLCFRDAAHGRRRRFKVRVRTYLDSGDCTLEVKLRGGRDDTVKHRRAYDAAARWALDDEARSFVDRIVGRPAILLAPTLVTGYQRATLLDESSGSRLTVDSDLVCATPDGSAARIGAHVVIETKSPGRPTPMDRTLWRRGARPVRLSKYCIGLAALDSTLPANRWARTLRRYVVTQLPRLTPDTALD